MKLFGIRKAYLIGLLFIVVPFGGLYLYDAVAPSGYAFMLSVENGSPKIENCEKVPDFSNYLKGLNEVNKPRNIVCEFSADMTTMSKGIQGGKTYKAVFEGVEGV